MSDRDFDAEAWEREIRQYRTEKDEFFLTDDASPIPAEDRDSFDGLQYFPLDQTYRIEAKLATVREPESVQLGANRGPDMEFTHVGTIGFTLQRAHQTLTVYQSPGVEEVFVPFRDATNGETTWRHGRYLNLSVDVDSIDQKTTVIVDFNRAYHPFCVYSTEFISVIPPVENELSLPIHAGERL